MKQIFRDTSNSKYAKPTHGAQEIQQTGNVSETQKTDTNQQKVRLPFGRPVNLSQTIVTRSIVPQAPK